MLRNAWIAVVAAALILFGMGQPALGSVAQLTAITTGIYHTCALENGQAYCWGDNGSDELGNGTSGGYSTAPEPVDAGGVLAGKTLTQISAGGFDTCALDSAGAAFCWGDSAQPPGDEGELGDGSYASSDVPVAVDTSGVLAGKTLTQVSVGYGVACALDDTGAAYCWGDNQSGALGDGTTTDSDVPVAVDTSGVLAGKILTQVSAGQEEACALDSTGAAYCWGLSNNTGSLGDGNQTPTNSPVPVAVDTSGVLAGKTLTQISVGDTDVCALDTTGTAYCWGYNNFGEIGNTSVPNAGTAVPVAVDTSGVLAGKTLTHISEGGYHTCVIDSAGLAYCWGWNSDGEVGNATETQADVPVAVDTSGVLAGAALTRIVAGEDQTCALGTGSAGYCWGYGEDGELGDGLIGSSDVPVAVVNPPGSPEPPQDVQATAGPGPGQATVTWSPPLSDGGSPVTSYTVTPQEIFPIATGTPETTSGSPVTITGLVPGNTYRFEVVATNAIGSSAVVASSFVTIPKQAPTDTALASSANPSMTGQQVTYTATVSPVPDGGTMAFTDNGSPIAGCGTQPVDTSTGQATCQATPNASGAHNIVATFSGSSGFAGSTSATLTQLATNTPCQSLAGCNLHDLNLTDAQLSGANLSNANLNGADLSGADLSGADLSGANLNGANLSGADLNGVDVAGANFNKVTWSNTTCPDGTNSNADGGTCTAHL
jgi:alpha-tubulin suppressor-like RCC1 family protein